VGRFQEISPYRLHAVHFYTGVLETVPEAGSRASLRKALDRAKGRKRDRDRRRDDLPLKPGSMHEEGRICVRFLGNSKFIHVEDLNEGRRARFSLVDFEVTEKEKGFDNTERGKDAGIVSGELSFSDETSDKTAWSVEYEWQESDASLRIKLPSGRWLRAER